MTDKIVFGTELERAAWDDDAQVWRCRTTSGEVVARTLITGTGGLSEPRLPDIEGIDTFAGALFHSAALGPLGRPRRQAGRGDRHRRVGDPDRARGAAGRRAPRRLPAHGAVGDPAQRPPLPEARAARAAPRAGAREALPHRHLLGARGLRARRSPGSRGSARRPRRPRRSTSRRRSRTPSSAPRSRRRFQLGCKRVLRSNTYYPALAARTSTSSPTRSPGSPRPGSSPVTGSSTRST